MKNEYNNRIIDFVYVDGNTNEFENIRIIISFLDDKLKVDLNSEIEISLKDLEGVLESIQKNNFSKLKISLKDDAACFLHYNSKDFLIDMKTSEQSERKIKLIPSDEVNK